MLWLRITWSSLFINLDRKQPIIFIYKNLDFHHYLNNDFHFVICCNIYYQWNMSFKNDYIKVLPYQFSLWTHWGQNKMVTILHIMFLNCIQIRISLDFVHNGPFDNKLTWVPLMFLHCIGEKPITWTNHDPVHLLTCITCDYYISLTNDFPLPLWMLP